MTIVRMLCLAGTVAVALAMTPGCASSRGQQSVRSELPDTAGKDEYTAADRYRLAVEHFIIARDYDRRGMRDLAGRFYEIALEFYPGSEFLRKTLIDIYMETDEFEKALALYGDEPDIAALSPGDKRTISMIYLKLGDLQKAAFALETLGKDKNEQEIYSLGLLYESAGLKDKAYDSFRTFFKTHESSVGFGIRLVQFNIGERRLSEACSLSVILSEVFPNNADVISNLGTVRYLSRDTAAAVKLFDRALELDSLNEDALRTLAHIYITRGETEKSIECYRRLVAIGEAGEIYRRGLAMLLFHKKEFDAAEKLFDELLEDSTARDGQDVLELHLYRGDLYSQTGRRAEAAREFEAAIAIDSLYEEAWRSLCYLYILAKEHDSAISAVDRYHKAFPQSGTSWKLRGYALNAAGKRDEAVSALRKAVSIDSLDYYAWFELGSTLERLKRIDEAADVFRQTLRVKPGDAPAANYLGYMWADANMMLDSAKILIEHALKKEPKNAAYLDSYAWVFFRLGDYEKAHHYMKEALAHEEGDPDPVMFEHLGDILFELKDYAEAESAYKRAIELKSEEAVRINKRLEEIKKLKNQGKGR